MPAAPAITKRDTIFVHPHHGVARIKGRPSVRKFKDKEVKVVTLVTPDSPGVLAVSGFSGAGFLASKGIHVTIPEEILFSGESAWTSCSEFDEDKFLELVRSKKVVPWFDKTDTPIPSKMVEKCRSYLSHEIPKSLYSPDECAELLCQVADYLAVWHFVWMSSDYDASARKREMFDDIESALSLEGRDFWMRLVGQSYTMKANGKEMLSIIGQLMGVMSQVSSGTEKEAALAIDSALSDRLRSNVKTIKKRALKSRE